LLDDNRDRDLQRNQIIGLVLIPILFIAWIYFFMPPQPPETAQPAPSPGEIAETEARDRTNERQTQKLPREAAESPEDPFAGLPPIPLIEDPATDEVRLDNEGLHLVFTRIGARLKQATIALGTSEEDWVQLVPEAPEIPDTEAFYPMGLRFQDDFIASELNRRRWDVETRGDRGEVIFSIEWPDRARIVKTFRLSPKPQVLDLTVEYTNLEDDIRLLGLDTVVPAFSLCWEPDVNSGDAHKFVKQEVIWRKGGTNERIYTEKLTPLLPGVPPAHRVMAPDWAAISSAYFVVAMKPEYEGGEAWAAGRAGRFMLALGAPRMELAPGNTESRSFQIYLGPRLAATLEPAWDALDTTLATFTVWGFEPMAAFMNWFTNLLLGVMNWFYNNAIANYGLAIIFCTFIVRGGMLPLTFKSMKSMKKMQKLAPELEKLKEEVGENQQELQKRMMELYRERGVSPLGGCFPLLLQMPVFIAFYRMLSNAFELRRAPFMLWITDLSEPDRLFQLPFGIPVPFGGNPIDSINLLPVLMGISMVASQKLMPASGPIQNPQQKLMMNMMPILFSVICYNMASGLNLYILTSTLLGIGQNYLINVNDVDVSPRKKAAKPAGKPRHFYSAAQERKRRLAKEIRREKKARRRNAPKDKPTGKS
jgi:YidC/Oxa1 family membrane protein insertase